MKRTVSAAALRRLVREDRAEVGGILLELGDFRRPKTRGECERGPRPCPWISCKYHLYLEINRDTGSIKFRFPGLEAWELAATCALDLAEEGGRLLEEIGAALNMTRERVRQIEGEALAKVKAGGLALAEHAEEGL